MVSAKVEILHEVKQKVIYRDVDKGHLCFQHCLYHYDNGVCDEGYRFIWRRPDDAESLQAARGQAILPSVEVITKLISLAEENGWGNVNKGNAGYEFPYTANNI